MYPLENSKSSSSNHLKICESENMIWAYGMIYVISLFAWKWGYIYIYIYICGRLVSKWQMGHGLKSHGFGGSYIRQTHLYTIIGDFRTKSAVQTWHRWPLRSLFTRQSVNDLFDQKKKNSSKVSSTKNPPIFSRSNIIIHHHLPNVQDQKLITKKQPHLSLGFVCKTSKSIGSSSFSQHQSTTTWGFNPPLTSHPQPVTSHFQKWRWYPNKHGGFFTMATPIKIAPACTTPPSVATSPRSSSPSPSACAAGSPRASSFRCHRWHPASNRQWRYEKTWEKEGKTLHDDFRGPNLRDISLKYR